jgi:glycosyltransferase involved in cell wall biosynthesis
MNARRPLVSIVTPSYNQGRFLARTIDSVLGQNYLPIEYLVMDGGSTDESIPILQSYGSRLTWVSEKDAGQADAINKGFARARGDILAYLNSDDVLCRGAVEKVAAYFEQHPDWDLVYGQAKLIDEHDRVIGMYRTKEFSLDRLMKKCFLCQPATFWRASAARNAGPFNGGLHYVMDYEYWVRLAQSGARLVHVPEVLASSRIYGDTKTSSGREQIFQEMIDVCRARFGYVPLTYFTGLWNARADRATAGWLNWLRPVPKFPSLVARLHHPWYNFGLLMASWKPSPIHGGA